MIAIANGSAPPLKAKLQRKRTLRLIITQQGLDLTMYAKILIVNQYITYHDTCIMSCLCIYRKNIVLHKLHKLFFVTEN